MSIEKLNICLTLPCVKAPTRAKPTDAGMDFYLPLEVGDIAIKPGERIQFDTGVAVDVPVGWSLLLVPRSGLGTRGINLANTMGVVDHGYRDSIKATIVNNGADSMFINVDDRYMQGLLVPIATPELVLQDSLGSGTRGGHGSTGR